MKIKDISINLKYSKIYYISTYIETIVSEIPHDKCVNITYFSKGETFYENRYYRLR
jgi:hypothetical protein